MMKSVLTTSSTVKYCAAFLFLLLLSGVFNACKQSEPSHVLIPLDTIDIGYNRMRWAVTYYHPFFNTQVVTFINVKDKELVQINLDDFSKLTFPFNEALKKSLENPVRDINTFLILDSSSFICNQNSREYLYKLHNKYQYSDIYTIKSSYLPDEIYLSMPMIPMKQLGDVLIAATPYIRNHLHFKVSTDDKRKMFSNGHTLLVSISDSILEFAKEIGEYPRSYLHPNSWYSYYVNCNVFQEKIVCVYPSIDSIGVTDLNGKHSYYPIKSRYKEKSPEFSVQSYTDVTVAIKELIENHSNAHITPDHFFNQIYITSIHATPYENDDGTVKELENTPWSIIVLNSDFQQIAELDVDWEVYAKQYYFPTSKGLMILNRELTAAHPERNFVFVRFKIEKK